MAAYIGQTVSLHLKNEGGHYCGKFISHDHNNGKVVLSKGNLLINDCNDVYYYWG